MTTRSRLRGEERDKTVKQQNPTANSFYRVTSLHKVNVSASGLITKPKSGKIPGEKDMSLSWPLLASRSKQSAAVVKLGSRGRKCCGLGPEWRPLGLKEPTMPKPASFLPFEMSLADSCRTSSGILSHWHSERHRSNSVSSREPDFLAVMFVCSTRRKPHRSSPDCYARPIAPTGRQLPVTTFILKVRNGYKFDCIYKLMLMEKYPWLDLFYFLCISFYIK